MYKLVALLILLPAAAIASTDAAWADLFRAAEAACKSASGLKQPAMIGQPVDFSDRVLVTVRGRWPQPHMNNQRATFACLYAKPGGPAEAHEVMRPAAR